MNNRKPAIVFHPGEHVLDEMHARNWTCKKLSKKSSISAEELKEIIVGERNIDADIAKKLSGAFGTSAVLWLNLQNQYDALKKEESNDRE